MDFELLLFLIFGHFIGDIALQTEWQAENKGRYWYVLFSHGMIWTGILSFILLYFGAFGFWKVPFLLIGHCVCDKWKSSIPKISENWKYIYPDQTWHLIQCLIVSIL